MPMGLEISKEHEIAFSIVRTKTILTKFNIFNQTLSEFRHEKGDHVIAFSVT